MSISKERDISVGLIFIWEENIMKLAVIFPGIGYHTDKPLLYYSKKIAKEAGYEIREVSYGNFPGGIKGDAKKMEAVFESALSQTEEILQDIDFSWYERILFISKSVGTAVAAAFGKVHHLKTENLYYTPVALSFRFMEQPGIVFHGTGDTWVTTDEVRAGCERTGCPLYLTENGNHSLEVGEALGDIENLSVIMKHTKDYITGHTIGGEK